jgi:hypothetical protein
VYAKSLHIYGFKCFGKAELRLQYPRRAGKAAPEIRNVNLLLGDNGSGKSSVLRALAIAVLAPALLNSGFVPYRLVRRPADGQPDIDHALLKVEAAVGAGELPSDFDRPKRFELMARIERRGRGGSLDRLHLDRTPDSPVFDLLEDDYSSAFFLVGYGATRRVEAGEYSESTARKARGLRYQRIAGLFEDHVALRPLQAWLPKLHAKDKGLFDAAVEKLNEVLPQNLRFAGELGPDDGQYLFHCNSVATPFSSLSDGYKAFAGWVGDLIGHLSDVAGASKTELHRVPGIVLVDEIDLHLHPEWQRTVVPTLAGAFPNLQFLFTSHSPIVASTVRKENVFLTEMAEDGIASVRQLDERVHGLTAEQLLLSSYFGLRTTRAESFQKHSRTLFQRAAGGDSSAALDLLERMIGKK